MTAKSRPDSGLGFNRFFIDRPIFASVLSVIITIVGALAITQLPISEYPEVVPPTVVVNARYPGANPEVIGQTVATPLEEAINGVDNMLYMSSQATSDGGMSLTVTFEIGTDPDTAQVQVQNRVAQALPRLPQTVRDLGVSTIKASADLTMVVHLTSPDARYDTIYLRNFAVLRIRDVLQRLEGVGQVRLFGAGDYAMRVWLDPAQMASRNLTVQDVLAAIREQNVEVAAGALGQAPAPTGADFQIAINARGRLESEEEFGNIVVATGRFGELVHLRDVARLELGSQDYGLRSLLDNQPAVAIPIFQAPGSNALAVSDGVRRSMAELSEAFPDGVDYEIVYDPTVFVRGSIEAVVHTLLEAVLLVVLVVIVFLQNWRAALIPLAAVPVSIVGTFAVLQIFGFSINVLTLFGLVLAIGIVVDDAIVVVENVERSIENGMSPREATIQAMGEVTGPIIATSLVLVAVFAPISFIDGLTGQFYRQFAMSIAVATIISTFNSLTLSPALARTLLRRRDAKPDALQRGLNWLFGRWLFRPFNRAFDRTNRVYGGGVRGVIRKGLVAGVVYAALVGFAVVEFKQVPEGFVPGQDKQYLVAFAQLPDAASIERTEDVIRRMGEIGLNQPGVENAVAFPGLSINGFTNAPNAGIVFFPLKPFDERKDSQLSGFAIATALQQEFGRVQEAFIGVFPPPPVRGLGNIGGFKLQVQDNTAQGPEALFEATQTLMAAARESGEIVGVFSSFQVNVPQLDAHVDREKAKQQGVPVSSVFQTLQAYLGSVYVNDFNRFGRTYQVILQAEAQDRAEVSDILRLKTRNDRGEVVPLGSVLDVAYANGPDRVLHYNGALSADINGGPAPGVSSGEAIARMEQLADSVLPPGFSIEWTDLTYHQEAAGNTAALIFPLVVLLVFLVLAAQYESLTLPLAVVLIVPMTLLSALAGVWITGGDMNVFTQVALFVLVGLAAKNAILIVEFAKQLEDEGRTPVEAAIEAARLRLRPILMTSFAFIMGVTPLAFALGAGAEMQRALGIAVFAGMLGVTFFGLIFTPLFYVAARKLVRVPPGSADDKQELHHDPA
nr:multidrug efflux RND transporter permease subunit [Abyssibacter sp.]